MNILKTSAIALMMGALPVAVQAQQMPAGANHMPRPMGGGMHAPKPSMPNVGGPRNWGPRHNGRWQMGYRAPGGWGGYRRPFVGYALPSYWINPSFYVGNYGNYGFARPSNGYGWSRYYNDAVMTDRYGRVQDYVEGVEWDRYDRYDDGANTEDYSDSYGYSDDGYRGDDRRTSERSRGRDRDGGLGGAIVGGAVGAIAGSTIAGRGDRTAGALIGGGLGALGGAAIDSSDRAGRGYKAKRPKYSRNRGRDMEYDYGYDAPDGVTQNGQWQGQWTGRWNDGPTQTWEGTYNGNRPHWDNGRPQGRPPVVTHHQGGGYGYRPSYGYGGSDIITVTVQSQPVVTTTTTVTEEVVYASAPRKRYVAKRHYKPRPKPRCICR
jgi:hypothetical protein